MLPLASEPSVVSASASSRRLGSPAAAPPSLSRSFAPATRPSGRGRYRTSGSRADARRERRGLLEMRVRRAVLATRQGRALAGLALARGRAAAGVGLVEAIELDLDRR